MSISPTQNDIGRAVIYTGNRYPGGKTEEGVITSFNFHCVFVRYGADKHSKGTSRADLEWATTLSRPGCICQEQHRRGYCTEPGCPYSVTRPHRGEGSST
jgi:hypothetical protein